MSIPHGTNKTRAQLFERKVDQPDPNPDGRYWQLGVQALQGQLTELIGREPYAAWAELVWPGDSVDKYTWQQMYEQLNRALDLAWNGERDVMKLVDAAEYPGQNVPGCYGLPD